MTSFECWVKGCEENNTKLFCLDGEGQTGFYKCQSWKLINNNYYGDVPTFHVWVEGKWVATSTIYESALALWEKEKRRLQYENDESRC